MVRNMTIQLFDSVEEENTAEYKRRAALSPEQRMIEFSAIQERVFGKEWQTKKIDPRVSYEILDW